MKAGEKSEEVLFREALRRTPGSEREAFLGRACEGNPALRDRLEALLQAQGSPDPFLEPPVINFPGEPMPLPPLDMPLERPGSSIGRYTLLEEIGEGAFGVVYLAEQTAPVRRKVALKVVKPGMDTREVIARFEAERQALALMDHPNIAKILDGGATETGRPFFVMELARGIPITDYCDQNTLSASERLRLFTQVCQAVQHAHQKGIIHRDLKPSNVLVTVREGEPVPRVIDFGVARGCLHLWPTMGACSERSLVRTDSAC